MPVKKQKSHRDYLADLEYWGTSGGDMHELLLRFRSLLTQVEELQKVVKPMQKSWDKISALTAENAIHRKGWAIQTVSPKMILAHAQEELGELIADPDDAVELADLFGCLLQYMMKMGWTLDQIDTLLLAKLAIRFKPQPGSEGQKPPD